MKQSGENGPLTLTEDSMGNYKKNLFLVFSLLSV